MEINGKPIIFDHHRRRVYEDPTTRVYVSQLSIGITAPELEEVFSFYGTILKVNPVTKFMHGRRIDKGDRIIIFKKMEKDIPSYAYVCGWRAYVKYDGQPQTCRVCGLTGHFAKDCPRVKKTTQNKDTPMETQFTESRITPAELWTRQESLLKNQLAVHLFLSMTQRSLNPKLDCLLNCLLNASSQLSTFTMSGDLAYM